MATAAFPRVDLDQELDGTTTLLLRHAWGSPPSLVLFIRSVTVRACGRISRLVGTRGVRHAVGLAMFSVYSELMQDHTKTASKPMQLPCSSMPPSKFRDPIEIYHFCCSSPIKKIIYLSCSLLLALLLNVKNGLIQLYDCDPYIDYV